MKSHKFDVEDAKEYGVKKAIILEHLKYHQEANYGNDRFMINGRSHAFIKKETVEKMFPYFSYKSVKRWLNELEKEEVIESCKPEKNTGKHIKFYHVIGHKHPYSERPTSISQNEKRNNGEPRKLPFIDFEGNSQNEKSNSQNESSARDNKDKSISQNESSSILPMCSRLSEGSARVNGVPLPDELADVPDFPEKYEFYCRYLKENFRRWPTATTTEVDLQKLAHLKRQGNDPIAVIDQTMQARNKSFYPIKNFESDSGDEDPSKQPDYTGVANASMYRDPDEEV